MKTKLMIALLLQFCLYGCITVSSNGKNIKGNGVSAHKDISLNAFKKLHVHASIDLKIVAGDSYSLSFTGDENLLALLAHSQKADLVEIYLTEKNITFKDRIVATLTMPTSLEEMETSGMPNVHIIQKITADKFTVESSGMSTVEIDNMFATRFDIDISGMSKVNVKGETTELNAGCSGMSDIVLLNLRAENADVDCSGMSKVKVWATQNLNADCSGMSHITYKGSPKSKDNRASGMSSIKQQ